MPSPAANTPRPPHRRRDTSGAGCVSAAVYLLLLGVGAAVLYGRFYEPIKEIIASQSWDPVPCNINQSEVEPAGPANSFKPSIRYYYRYGDRTYRSNRVWFLKRGSDTKADVQALVARYPAGSQAFCYVNPENPEESVLERGLKPALLVALVPLGMVLVGLAGLTSIVWLRAFPRVHLPDLLGPRTHQTPSGLPAQLPPPGPVKRRARRGLKSGLFYTLVIALAWNAIMYFLAREVINNWRGGPPSPYGVLLTVFSLPFLLAGLVLALMPLYLLRKLFHPRPTITLSESAVTVGDSIELTWRLSGRIDKIRRLRVSLEGREEATFDRDDDMLTETEVFAAIPLATTRDSRQIRAGHCTLRVPVAAVPSFESFHNKIAWSVRVYTDSRPWPGFDEQFELLVLPRHYPSPANTSPDHAARAPSPSLPAHPEARPA